MKFPNRIMHNLTRMIIDFDKESVVLVNLTLSAWPTLYRKYDDQVCRSQWPRGLRHRSSVARLLRLCVRIPPGHGCLSVVSVVCCQVEVSATDWSLIQRSPTDCGASLCVIKKPRKTRRLNPATRLWTPGKQTTTMTKYRWEVFAQVTTIFSSIGV
jgi:hypothetical protein